MMKLIKEHKFITVLIIAAVIIVAAALSGFVRASHEDPEKQAASIRDTIAKRALQCYVIENAYPESLAYLEENYGLAVNKEDFRVIYTPYAENLPPDIRVIYRGEY